MDTNTDFADKTENKLDNLGKPEDKPEYVLPFEIREQFRPKLLEYFEMTNKRSGAYLWAEEKTFEYFESKGIPRIAWAYRTRVH